MTHQPLPAPDAARLDVALVAVGLVASRRKASRAISSGKVEIDGVVTLIAGTPVPPGAKLHVDWNRAGTGRDHVAARALLTDRRVDVVFEDGDLLVLNKPPGMLTDTATRAQERDGDSLRHLIERYLRPQGAAPIVVHRIDRDTSGLVAMAKSADMARQLKAQFAQRTPERLYWCAVHGGPTDDTGTFSHWMVWNAEQRQQLRAVPQSTGAVLASARWRVIARDNSGARPGVTVLEVRLHTGRRNQIRLHCQLEGIPLVGERQYIAKEAQARGPARRQHGIRRQALHASRLGLKHPRSGAQVRFDAPLPADLARLLRSSADKPAGTERTRARPGSGRERAPSKALDSPDSRGAPSASPTGKIRLKPRRAKDSDQAHKAKRRRHVKKSKQAVRAVRAERRAQQAGRPQEALVRQAASPSPLVATGEAVQGKAGGGKRDLSR